MELAEDALARGDLATAEERFARVLATRSGSVRAQQGLGRVALARGDRGAARQHFEAALAAEPEAIDALLDLAAVEESEGRMAEAELLLRRAVVADPRHPAANARAAKLTGRAAEGAPATLEAALERARAHPYDTRALLAAALRLLDAGRTREAGMALRRILWLSDLDPRAGVTAFRRLGEIDEGWRRRQLIPVHVLADETLQEEEGWRFRLRTIWSNATAALGEPLEVVFLPVSIQPFRGAGTTSQLAPHFARLVAITTPGPPQGIVAGFTARPPPDRPGEHKLGLAEFLGRRLLVRLPPERRSSRVLAHELLHLYGAIHVSPELDSLMNPTGGSHQLDAPNGAIVRALRGRRFSRAGFESDVLAHIELEKALAAYAAALRTNLAFRQAGIVAAFETRDTSRYLAAQRARRARALDPHLADVAGMLARLMLADERRAEALLLFDLTAKLYGRRTPEGRRAEAAGRDLAAEMERRESSGGR